MPIPKPKDDEEKKDFISRCMGNPTMVEDYPDNKQRLAVCYASWDREKDEDDDEEKGNDMTIEHRMWKQSEIRAVDADGVKHLVGHAAVFNSLSQELWGFREKIAPGAFKRTIDEGADVRALLNHDPNYVLGRTVAKTLVLSEDDRGLRVDITPPNTQWAKDLIETVSRGDISQMSFGFIVRKEQWEENEDQNIRTLLDVDLFDVSPVTFPAYPATDIQARSILGIEVNSIEKVLIRVEHKLPLTDKDRSVIHRAMEMFASLEDTLKEPDGEKLKDTLQAAALVAIRKRLLNIRNRNL